MFYKNVNRLHLVRVYMKKIVSTMFKCGAICASLNTVFADGDFVEAERKTQYIYGLISDEKLTEIVSVGFLPENDFYDEGYSRVTEEIEPSETEAEYIHKFKELHKEMISEEIPCYIVPAKAPDGFRGGAGTPLNCLLFQQQTAKEQFEIFNAIREDLYDYLKISSHGISLFPNDIYMKEITTSQKGGEFIANFSESRRYPSLYGNGYELMQLDRNKPHEALACLMLYITCPELRVYFEENEIRVKDKKFERFSESQGKWLPLPEGNFYVKHSTLLYNGKISIEALMEVLKKKFRYEGMIPELKISAYGSTPQKRFMALSKAIEIYNCDTPEQSHWVKEIDLELFYRVIMMQALDQKNKSDFREYANCYPALAKKLLAECSISPEEGKIQIFPESIKILEDWFCDGLIYALKAVTSGLTPKERSEALNKAVVVFDCNNPEKVRYLKKNYRELYQKAILMQIIDHGTKEQFFKYASLYPETARKLLAECSTKTRLVGKEEGKKQISPESMAMIEEWLQQQESQKLSTQSPATVSAN